MGSYVKNSGSIGMNGVRLRAMQKGMRSPLIQIGCFIIAAFIGLPAHAGVAAPELREPECQSNGPAGPMQITADCLDPAYNENNAVIDATSEVTTPEPYHQVSGHFDGTPYKFNFYFPSAGHWHGRFYQHVYPLQSEIASAGDIAFAFASGGYLVQTSGGPCGCSGYRVDAAAARFSRRVSAEYYHTSARIYGYIWGGSGGSFQTIGAIENSTGIWDGAVPYVIGNETSIPNNNAVVALASLILKDKLTKLADAAATGGGAATGENRQPPLQDLTPVESAAFEETTRFGLPVRTWERYPTFTPELLLLLAASVKYTDPTYVDDFWNKPGYEGADPAPYLKAALIDQPATVTRINFNERKEAASAVIDTLPANPSATGLEFWVYKAGASTRAGTLNGTLDASTRTITFTKNDPNLLGVLRVGDQLRINNRWYLALSFYHRHQIPKTGGFYAFDQFKNADGQPLYPQRDVAVGANSARDTAGGGSQTGKIRGKVIVVDNLMDSNAFPWGGDWYANRVRQALGEQDFSDSFRLYFNDNADHFDRAPQNAAAAIIVNYVPSLYQALRDVTAWVERGTAPPDSTRYRVAAGQIEVPDTASARHGIQPVIHLTAGNESRIEVSAGQEVTFRANVSVPPKAGKIVGTGWDFSGEGAVALTPLKVAVSTLQLQQTHRYATPGTYFAVLHAASQRSGDTHDAYTQIENLARVRVIVR
jgi:hypothetical protein